MTTKPHPEPPEDGIYRVDQHRHVFIHQGALHLPTNLLPPGTALDPAKVVHVVMSQTGWGMSFARADELTAACPQLAAIVRKIADRLGCTL